MVVSIQYIQIYGESYTDINKG